MSDEVKTRFTFDVDDKPLERLHKGIESLKEGLFGLTATLVESGFALYETVVKTAEAGEAAIKLGQSTGVGTQKIQELQYAAQKMGLQSEDLSTSLKFLNRNMFQVAKGGGGLNDAFTRFGINIHQANGQLRPANDVLGDLAERFKSLPDGPEKAGLAMQFFGRQGQTLIPLLNKGRQGIAAMGDEAEQLGYVLSEKDAKAGEDFQQSLKVLMAALTGIRNIVASELMPALTDIIGSITGWIKQNRELIKTDFGGFLKGTIFYLKLFFNTAMSVANAIAGFTHIVGGAENATKLFLGAIGLLAGASILYGLGSIVTAIYGIATAWTVADAAALLIPIGIGLAIIAVGLLAEDLYQFFTGGDSVFGRMIAALTPFIMTFVDGVRNIGAAIITVLLAPLRLVIGVLGDIIGLAGKIPGLGALKGIGATVSAVGSDLLDTSNLFVPGGNPGGPGGQPGNSTQSNINVNAPISVNVPQGTPPSLVGDAVSKGVSDGVSTHLRQAQRATSSTVNY